MSKERFPTEADSSDHITCCPSWSNKGCISGGVVNNDQNFRNSWLRLFIAVCHLSTQLLLSYSQGCNETFLQAQIDLYLARASTETEFNKQSGKHTRVTRCQKNIRHCNFFKNTPCKNISGRTGAKKPIHGAHGSRQWAGGLEQAYDHNTCGRGKAHWKSAVPT